MHENTNKVIGYMVLAIIAYHILSAIVPLLIVAVIAMVLLRYYQEWNK